MFSFAKVKTPSNLHTRLASSVAEDFKNERYGSTTKSNKQQILFNDFTLPEGSQHLLRQKFGIFITLIKYYIYGCKMMEKFPLGNQFKQKLNIHWKIQNSGN